MNLYLCEKCGNLVLALKETGVPLMCCGQKMTKLIPGISDGAAEKHVPVVEETAGKVSVSVGSVPHPMLDAHLIEWIAIETTHGIQKKDLKAGEEPKAEFALTKGETLIGVYAYCNLHGLWKA